MSNVVEMPPRCSCAEIEGEDPECPLHGMTIERVAAWTDDDCMIDPEIDSFTVRRFAQKCLARASMGGGSAAREALAAQLERMLRLQKGAANLLVSPAFAREILAALTPGETP